MIVSDYIAIGAIIVSFVSIIVSIILYNNQKKYIRTQDDLNKLLLQKEKNNIEAAEEAYVSANVVKVGSSNHRIRIFNKGSNGADNVRISFPEEHNWIVRDDKFPLEFLDPRQSVDILLAMHLSSQSKVKIILYWIDKKGPHENDVILTR